MANFSIIALRVFAGNPTNIQKVLNEGWYSFNQSYKPEGDVLKPNEEYPLDANFFGNNINITAIVGKNGSGKSSLLEIFFRMVYNLSVKMDLLTSFKGHDKPSFSKLNAEVYFVANSFFYGLKNENKSIRIFKQEITKKTQIDTSQIDWGNEVGNDYLVELKEFFYSIVLNYSMQAYISNDYYDNDTKYSWIDYLFHKNDAYTLPLVLNPKRDDGTIDLNTEYNLTIQRLSALLIENKKFIPEYEFKSISLKSNFSKVDRLFEELKTNDDRTISDNITDNSSTIKDEILSCYNIKDSKRTNSNSLNSDFSTTTTSLPKTPLEIAYEYLVLKTISISTKYYGFTDYKLNIKSKYDKTKDDLFNKNASKYKTKIEKLVAKITDDTSHITLKIKQVLNFIEYAQNSNVEKIQYDYLLNNKSFKRDTRLSKLDQILAILPPPFYKFEIQFNKNIKVGKMSSGERQFLFSMSTVLYHIKNLMSVPESDEKRVKYKNFNIILDEIEICFHPEYQRLFVSKLIDTITRLELNENCAFNIILSTHSPFMLSDIPNCNIMYLEEGKQVNAKIKTQTFGANINDILKDSFFLDKGFIGDFAQKKIKEILELINDKKEEKKGYIQNCIKIIGEPLIKEHLQNFFNEKFGIKDKKDKEIERKDEEIEQLKEKIKQLEAPK